MGKELDVRLAQVSMISNLGLALMAASFVILGYIYTIGVTNPAVNTSLLKASSAVLAILGAVIFLSGYWLSKRILEDDQIK